MVENPMVIDRPENFDDSDHEDKPCGCSPDVFCCECYKTCEKCEECFATLKGDWCAGCWERYNA